MSIRNQLKFYIIPLILIPIFSVLILPIHQQVSSHTTTFVKDFKKIKKANILNISDEELNILNTAVNHIHSDTQTALISNKKILISTIPELPKDKILNEHELWIFIKKTSKDFLYQFETPPIGTKENQIILISRLNKNVQIKSFREKNISALILLIIIFTTVIFCLTIVIKISKTISNSLSILEKQAMEIANGNFNIEIDTDNKKANEITSINGSLTKMKNILQENHNNRSTFIMGISHDLRTPIAVIKGYAEAISDGVISNKEEILKSINIIASKSNQLETMVDTFINYEKITNENWINKIQHEKLHPFLFDFLQVAKQTGTVFKRRVNTHIAISENTKISFNKQLLQRALENLFSNAIRYSKQDDLIEISAIEYDSCIEIKIKDYGCGIDKKDIKNIFDLFYRGTSSRKEEGLGIGLSVVKKIIDIHNWKINVESEINKGTTFLILIPKNHL